ncbi:hypothetical protein DFH08DRAFT_800120 [Mycena albidolilacea]|uniref:Uncharacterized protein n=1 Tax=Mycena albidolilacea TaxID=1033008 RepID=A0AAD7AKH5_9AGAR|nr:hypothetical protein DFH08DRAFT_800120 [Mycena albidolilacea]
MSPKCENTRWDRGFYWSDVGVLESRWGASTRQCEHVEWKLNNGIATARIDGRFSTFPGSARERAYHRGPGSTYNTRILGCDIRSGSEAHYAIYLVEGYLTSRLDLTVSHLIPNMMSENGGETEKASCDTRVTIYYPGSKFSLVELCRSRDETPKLAIYDQPLMEINSDRTAAKTFDFVSCSL